MDQFVQLVQIGKDNPLVLCLVLAGFLSVAICLAFAKLPSLLKTREPNVGQMVNIVLNQSKSSPDLPEIASTVIDRILPLLLERGTNDQERETDGDA